MAPAPNDHPVPADPVGNNDYDSFAEAYAAENETGVQNAYHERPAMLGLVGDVAGRRILDAGFGSGPLFAALRDRGATVTGLDASSAMLAIARRKLGSDAELLVADLTDRLPLARPEAGWPASRLGRPSVRDPRHPTTGWAPYQLLRDVPLDRGVDPRRSHLPDELLDPAAERDD